MNALSDGPINGIINRPVTVTSPEGETFTGAIEAASSRHLDVRYVTGHKGQFSQLRRFRRKNLHGYDEGWLVGSAAIEVAA